MAREAIELHLEGLIEEGGVAPLPSTIDQLRADPDHADGIWAMVSVDESTLRVKITRVGITMPQRVLDAIDRHAREHGETRSGLLARAAIPYIGREPGSMPEADRGGAKLRVLRRTTLKSGESRGAGKVRKGASRKGPNAS